VHVADKQDLVRDRGKAPGKLLRRIRRAVEVPEVFNPVGIEPGLDMAEQAAADLKMGLQAAHEGEDRGAVALAHLLIGVEAEADVVISPDAHGANLLKKADRFLHSPAHFENVTQDHEAVCPVLLQHGDGLPQMLRLLVDIGQ
jgi:hypothetical protein